MSRFLRALWITLALSFLPAAAFAQIDVSITVAPPPLPVYSQPIIPGPGYLWTPGFWAWGDDGYFWVPGTWVRPPSVGVLWTPGYWAWSDRVYLWHAGYWGPHIGFYGGVNYGFGYTGSGYRGGYWNHGEFAYNRSVNNINTTIIHNTYNENIVNNTHITRVSFNGGSGGIMARPTPAEMQAAAIPHVAPTPEQMQHQQAARANRALYASVNHGRPAIAATPRPGAFSGEGVVSARAPGGRAAAPAAPRRAMRPNNSAHAMPQGGVRAANTHGPAGAQRVVRPVVRPKNVPHPQPAARATKESPQAAPGDNRDQRQDRQRQ
jgi:hypothetical protein